MWAWKSFLRGHHPILMDFGLLGGLEPGDAPGPDGGVSPFEQFEPARFAMGETRRYADRMDLVAMEPRGDISSTAFALASPGREYLVLQPEPSAPITVQLEAGRYAVEWHDVSARTTRPGDEVTIDAATGVDFRPPTGLAGPAVLYLRSAAVDRS